MHIPNYHLSAGLGEERAVLEGIEYREYREGDAEVYLRLHDSFWPGST